MKLKGAFLFIIGAPESETDTTNLKHLEEKLKKNKSCGLIIQFGKHEKEVTDND